MLPHDQGELVVPGRRTIRYVPLISLPWDGRHESSAAGELSPSCSSMTSTTRSRKSDSFILGEPRTSSNNCAPKQCLVWRRLDINFSYPENLWKPNLQWFTYFSPKFERNRCLMLPRGRGKKKTADAVKQIWYPTIVIELLPGLTQQQSHLDPFGPSVRIL